MEISKDNLNNIRVMLDDIITLMELKEVDTLEANTSTYGMHNDFIFVSNKGFIDLNKAIEELENMEE